MIQSITNNYKDAIQAIKQAILKSRYKAATLANREMLMLYYGVGEYISQHTREGQWGTNAIELISEQLQKELPGVRGFSTTNLRNMHLFYEVWKQEIPTFEIRPLPTDEFDLENNMLIHKDILIRQIPSGELENDNRLSKFVSIGFSHHAEIIMQVKSLDEHLFYIERCAIA